MERFFGTLNTQLWSTLPGYVGSNTVERNPKTKAELTIAQIAEKFDAFIERYHNQVHSELGTTPLQYWIEHCHTSPVDERQLDILMLEPASRRVIKEGIKYQGRMYWHQELATFVGQDVVVRAQPHYAAPDEVEVFADGRWICTAFATDSSRGYAVGREEVAGAQRAQREAATEAIRNARSAVAQADREIAEQEPSATSIGGQNPATENSPEASPALLKPVQPLEQNTCQPTSTEEDDDEDLFDMLIDA